jgi:hypothetical protein
MNRSSMRGRSWVVACGCVGVLLLGACGRLGFELLGRGDDPGPAVDAGDRDAQSSPTLDAAIDGAAAGAGGEPPPRDGGVADDASTDAAQTPDTGSPDDDAGSSPDAGDASDAGDAGGCDVAAITDYCSELPPLGAAPVIDGVLDCGPPLLDITPVGWTSTTSPLPAGVSARLAAAWRPDGVYFFVDVDDPTRLPRPASTGVWCGDGVELYVDDDGSYMAAPMYDAPGSIQALALAPGDDATSVSTGGERYRSPNGGLVSAWSSPRYAAFPRPGGYTFEAFIMADDLDLPSWTLAAGGAVGLDVSINVSTSADPPPASETAECGLRLGQFFLRVAGPPCGPSCLPFSNAAAFCNPVLR